MKFKKALIINIDKSSLGPAYWERINRVTDKKVFFPKDSPQIKKELADIDCLLVNFGVTVNKEMMDSTPKLKYIGVLATAFGKVDVGYAKRKKIIVCNIPGYSTESVAEFVFATILEHIRQLEEGKKRGRSGNYSEVGISALEIKSKIFGIIGLGKIGRRVAEIAQGFSADVRYWSRNRKKDVEKKGIKYTALDDLVQTADFLSINLAQNQNTEGIFNKKRFQELRTGAIVINTAPMELVDIDGLAWRLKKGDITFILDHSDEMSEEDLKRLSKYSNCIIYPPIAYVSKEAAIMKREMFVSNIENFLKGKPSNVIN